MLSNPALVLLKCCRNHVAQLIEIHDGSGTRRPDLFHDLRQIDALTTPYLPASQHGVRWVDDVRATLEFLGGTAHLSEITAECIRRRRESGRSVPRNSDAIIRDTLHAHSSDAAKFYYVGSNTQNFFRREHTSGPGWWSLRSKSRRQ